MKSEHRNLNLDLIKLIACAAVVGLHIHIHDSCIPARTLYFLCTIGVPLFFMCTGYLILDRQHFTAKYISRKLLAILRVVLLWSVIAAILKYGGLYLTTGKLEINPFLGLLRVLILGLQDQGVMFVMWYLGALFLVYITLPWVSRLLRGPDGKTSSRRLFLLWLALAVLIVASRITSLCIGRMLQNRVWLTYRLWTYWQFLLLGALMKRLQPWITAHISLTLHLLLTLVLSAAAAAEFVLIMERLIENAWGSTAYDSLVMMLWCTALFSLVMRFRLSASAEALIQRLAPLTMGVFLIHPLLMEIVSAFLDIEGFWPNELYYIIVLTAAFCCTWVLKKLPGGKLLTTL